MHQMDGLLLRYPTTPIYLQRRPSPLTRSIHFVLQAGERKRRRRIKRSALKKASNLTISLTSSFLRFIYNTSLDLFLLYGGRPPISTGGSGEPWWRLQVSRRTRLKMIADLMLAFALTSQVVWAGGRSAARVLVLGIVNWKRWLALAILGIMLYAFAL